MWMPASTSRDWSCIDGDEMKVTDPVCGRKIDMAEVAGCVDHEGWAYVFCSEDCRTRLAARPNAFAHEEARAACVPSAAGSDRS